MVISLDNPDTTSTVRRAVALVALLNLAYFFVEFAIARAIGSVSLFADSIDFLEDTAVNGLIVVGLAWSVRQRAKLAMALAGVLLLPGLATAWTAWQQWHSMHVPAPEPLALTGLGALVVNLSCAYLLARVRHAHGSLTRAAFLSARNDALANVAIIGAGAVTAWIHSAWPDLLVGLGICLMNLDAAREVYGAAKAEHRDALESAP
jgi:Co/Zn/Cd efflux system component